MKMKTAIQSAAFALALGGLIFLGATVQHMGSANSTTNKQSPNQPPVSQNAGLSNADRRFIKQATESGLAEIQLGRLATEKASNEAVKKFCQRMIDDTSTTNDHLRDLAISNGLNLPSNLTAKDQATNARLSNLSGQSFDRAYIRATVNDQAQDVAEFRHESHVANDPNVKSFASQTLPTLQDHLKEAKGIAPGQKTGHAQ